MDFQKAQRARIELQTLKMTWPEIDEYISKFKSIAHEASLMPCTNNHREMPLKGPTFETPGKHKDNIFKITKTNNHKGKGLGKHHSTPLPLQSPGTTSWSQWTLTGQEPQEGTGEDEVEGSLEETLLEQMMSEPKEGYRVHASATAC